MKFPRPNAKTIFICIGTFFFFLVVRFPVHSLRGQIFETIYKQTGISLTAEDIYLSFFGWPGIGMRNVEVSIPANVTGFDMDVSAKKAVARVGLGGLLPPRLSYSLSMSNLKKGGDLYVKFTPGKGKHTVVLDAEKLALSQVPVRLFPEPMSGALTAYAKITLDEADAAKTVGNIDLVGEGVKIPAFAVTQDFGDGIQLTIPFPAINLGPLRGQIPVRGGVAALNGVQLGKNDSDIFGTLNGELRLQRDMLQSFLNLNVQLQISEKLEKDPRSENLLSSINGMKIADRKYAMRWNASLYDMMYRGKGIPEVAGAPRP